MAVRPFPYASLPKLTRRQRHLLAALRSCWEPSSSERVRSAASSLLGRELSIQIGIGDSYQAPELLARCAATAGIAVLIEQAQVAKPITCTIELTHQAAQQLVDLALGGDAELLESGVVPLDELSRGALAYVVARILAALGESWTLRNISELSQLTAANLEDCVICPIALKLGSLSLSLRAYVPERVSISSLPERVAIRNLQGLRVTLVAYAGFVSLPAHALRELGRGDVIVLEETSLVREHSRWRGSVCLAVQGSRTQLRCQIEEQGLRVADHAQAKELGMNTGHTTTGEAGQPTANNLPSDAPIELQIEIARFSLSLGELQRLHAGDVLITGRRIGEQVSVRIGGQLFAQGELVDVEGEIGVRLQTFTDISE